MFKIIIYAFDKTKLEVKCNDQFRVFNNVFVQFTYNITYRRAAVNSFATLYNVLKLTKDSTIPLGNNVNVLKCFLLAVFLLVSILIKLTLGISYYILRRSFTYSRAFAYEKYQLFDSYV